MLSITPFLWFTGQAEEAANFYVSVFKNSRITDVSRYGEAGPGPVGSVMTIEFELDGQSFMAINDAARIAAQAQRGLCARQDRALRQLRDASRARRALG